MVTLPTYMVLQSLFLLFLSTSVFSQSLTFTLQTTNLPIADAYMGFGLSRQTVGADKYAYTGNLVGGLSSGQPAPVYTNSTMSFNASLETLPPTIERTPFPLLSNVAGGTSCAGYWEKEKQNVIFMMSPNDNDYYSTWIYYPDTISIDPGLRSFCTLALFALFGQDKNATF